MSTSHMFTGAVMALIGGVAVTLQAALLAFLGRGAGSIPAGLLTYAAGGALATLFLVAGGLVAGAPASLSARAVWLGSAASGALGLVIVVAIAFSTARIAVAAGLAFVLVGQMLAAVIVDALGVAAAPVAVDLRRMAGLALVAAGAFLLAPR